MQDLAELLSPGEWLQDARLQSDISEATLAEAIGVSPQTIISWEADRTLPKVTPDKLIKLCQILGKPIEELLIMVGGYDPEDHSPISLENPTFGEWMAMHRAMAGFTISGAASVSGVSARVIREIETDRDPSLILPQLISLCKAINADIMLMFSFFTEDALLSFPIEYNLHDVDRKDCLNRAMEIAKRGKTYRPITPQASTILPPDLPPGKPPRGRVAKPRKQVALPCR